MVAVQPLIVLVVDGTQCLWTTRVWPRLPSEMTRPPDEMAAEISGAAVRDVLNRVDTLRL